METINDRMEQLVNKLFNGNKAAFARAIETDGANLSNYIGNKRRSKPSVDMVTKIVTALNVDPLWLLTGKASTQPNAEASTAVGPYAAAAVGGNATVSAPAPAPDAEVLRTRLEASEQLIEEKDKQLAEKERTIRLYEQLLSTKEKQ